MKISVRKLEHEISVVKMLLDEKENDRQEIENEAGAIEDRLHEAQRALGKLGRKLGVERAQVSALHKTRTEFETKWLTRIESMRADLQLEQSLWIEEREGDLARCHEDLIRRRRESERAMAEREKTTKD